MTADPRHALFLLLYRFLFLRLISSQRRGSGNGTVATGILRTSRRETRPRDNRLPNAAGSLRDADGRSTIALHFARNVPANIESAPRLLRAAHESADRD